MVKKKSDLLPLFIINLVESSDRKEYMKNQCEILDVSPLFIDAIDGKKTSISEINRFYNKNKAKIFLGRELLLGEIGCAMSHKKIYQKIVDENISYAIILEDDSVIKENFNFIIELILSSDIEWELILLGHHKDINKGIPSPLSIWGKHYLTKKLSLNRLADFGFGTYAYIISIEGAKKMIQELDVIYKPIDHYTSDSNIVNVYALYPTIVSVNDNLNTTIDKGGNRKIDKDRKFIVFLKNIGIINNAIYLKSIFKILKPIKKYR